jgi:elongation factor P hydroxylase
MCARFNTGPGLRYGARLEGGAPEPLYEPATPRTPARICYRLDYAQSALHELAHWCLAGPKRRALTDYGYWYVPPPRTADQRARFFEVESRVQGFEALLADLAGVRFHVSLDDPGADAGDFAERVRQANAAWRASARSAGALPARTVAVLVALEPHWRARLEGMAS